MNMSNAMNNAANYSPIKKIEIVYAENEHVIEGMTFDSMTRFDREMEAIAIMSGPADGTCDKVCYRVHFGRGITFKERVELTREGCQSLAENLIEAFDEIISQAPIFKDERAQRAAERASAMKELVQLAQRVEQLTDPVLSRKISPSLV